MGLTGDGYVKNYKSYVSFVYQTLTDAPVVITVLENTIGGDLIWTYESPGLYFGSCPGIFTSSTKIIFPQFGDGDNGILLSIMDVGYINIWRQNDNSIAIRTYSDMGLTPADINSSGFGFDLMVDLRIYP